MPVVIKRSDTVKEIKERIKSRFGSKFVITDEELNNKSICSSFLQRLIKIEAEEKKQNEKDYNDFLKALRKKPIREKFYHEDGDV